MKELTGSTRGEVGAKNTIEETGAEVAEDWGKGGKGSECLEYGSGKRGNSRDSERRPNRRRDGNNGSKKRRRHGSGSEKRSSRR